MCYLPDINELALRRREAQQARATACTDEAQRKAAVDAVYLDYQHRCRSLLHEAIQKATELGVPQTVAEVPVPRHGLLGRKTGTRKRQVRGWKLYLWFVEENGRVWHDRGEYTISYSQWTGNVDYPGLLFTWLPEPIGHPKLTAEQHRAHCEAEFAKVSAGVMKSLLTKS